MNGSRKPFLLAALGVVLLAYYAWNNSPSSSDSTPSSSQKVAAKKTSNNESIQRSQPTGPERPKILTKETNPRQAELASRVGIETEGPYPDYAFESWLDTYGYSLSVADMISMLSSPDYTVERRQRLFDFFLTESPDAYDFFHSREGVDFLESLLADKTMDQAMAKKIGKLLQWSNSENETDASDTYAQRLATSNSIAEKTGLVAAINDTKLLRGYAYDYKQPTAVREAAIEGLVREGHDPARVKELLDLTETQPELEASLVRSAALACRNAEELLELAATLRKEGSATDNNAIIIGKAFAGYYQYTWVRSIDPDGQAFVKKILETYRDQAKFLYSSNRGYNAP